MIELVNSSAEAWFRYLASATVQAVLLALVILTAVRLFARRSPAWRHALLMIALLKFAVPPTLTLPSGLFSRLNPEPSARALRSVPYAAPLVPMVDEFLWPAEEPPSVPVKMSAGAATAQEDKVAVPVRAFHPRTMPSLKGWLMLCHILGALVFLAIVILEKVRLRRLTARTAAATDEGLRLLFDQLCGRIKPARKPRLLISAARHSPMTFGAWKPVVLLPQALVEALPPEELQVILGHELAHQRRWDLWLSWLQIPISAIWWFNPVYWFLSRKIRSVREDCCDDLVVASGLATGEAYCETLLQAARVASGCALNGVALAYIDESHPLRRRLKRIMTSKRITAPRIAWIGIILLILLALLFLPGIRKRSAPQNQASATAGAQKGETPDSNSAGQKPATTSAVPNIPTQPPLPDGVPASVIQVRVIERATERPVPNAALLLAAAQKVKDMDLVQAPHTDSDGRCTIPAPEASTLLTVRAEGFVPRHLRLPSPEAIPHEYICKLDKGSSIGGYVHDEEGKPLENVKLSIYSSNVLFDAKQRPQDLEATDNWIYAQTDRSGRWTATELVPDPERIQLTLDHPERATIKFDTAQITGMVIMGGTPTEHASMSDLKEGKAVLVMKNGLLVSGRVMDDAGRGIEGCEVLQYNSRSAVFTDWMLAPARTDADGRFALRIAAAGEIMLYAQAKGFAAEERAVKVVPGLPPIEFRLKKGEIVSGRVVDEGGNPIPNATVRTGNPLIGRTQPFSWTGKTDDSGRFLWDSAPAKPLSYGVSAAGYDPAPSVVLAPGKENEIRLARGSELIITGKVTDAKTKMPVDNFKVSLSSLQMVMRTVDGKGGEFTLTLPVRTAPATIGGREMTAPTYGILVEAEGYLPDLSQSVQAKPGGHFVEISLDRGGGLSGVVLLPGGSPAANAGVFLCGGSTTSTSPSGALVWTAGPSMNDNIKSIRCSGSSGGPFSAAAETDASGRFSLKAVPEAHSFYAVHEKGFAALVPESLPDSGNIRLQPWGRIEGVLMVGRKPGANQPLSLSTLAMGMSPRPPELRVALRTETDSDGRFTFASVPPGEYRISHRPAAGSGGQSADAIVRYGETAAVKIGGTGRPVTGRIVVSGQDPDSALKIQSAGLSLKLPDDNMPSPTDAAAYREWMESEAGRARQRMQRSYSLRLGADGTFRIEDVQAGTYTLTVYLGPAVVMGAVGMPASRPERLTREIVVPEMPGGRSDDTLDLGAITLEIPPKK